MATDLPSLLRVLDEQSPGVPLLALGQTVLWDEPMKAGVALQLQRMGSSRRFVAGIHDTDYFAKLPTGPREPGTFRAMPHNGTTTRALWSAAAEFSALFGSETVITRQDLQSAGTRIEKIMRRRPHLLDQATEAYGWRGIVSLDDEPPIANETPIAALFDEFRGTLQWALDETLECIAGEAKPAAAQQVDRLWSLVCAAFERHRQGTLTNFYRDLIRPIYAFAAGEPVELETAQTSELLRFNRETCHLPRFESANLFLNPETRAAAVDAYNAALAGSEIYGLDRFGSGAIPFDVVVPGHGRGTLRLGRKGLVVMARKPLFVTLRRPVESVADLASALESKFGPDCSLIGKAVTLISMLSREFLFVFHEGASGYVRYTRAFHEHLAERGIALEWHPIVRLVYPTWDALSNVHTWFHLPKAFHLAFGAEEICAPSFAKRWREVAAEQTQLLQDLSELRRPVDLVRFLNRHVGGAWNTVAHEYDELARRLEGHLRQMAELKAERRVLLAELRAMKSKRVAAERAKGEHFRAEIFEKEPSTAALNRREELAAAIEDTIAEIDRLKAAIRHSIRRQRELALDPAVIDIHERRRALELEAELKRMRLVRNAVICSRSLQKAGWRPSAWWFPLVSPDGAWFRDTVAGTQAYLEPLSVAPQDRSRTRERKVKLKVD